MRGAYRHLEEGGRGDWRSLGRLLRYVLPHRGLLAASVGVMALMSVLTLAAPGAAALAVERGIAAGDGAALTRWGIVFVLLSALRAALEYARLQLTILTGQRVIYDVRLRLFRHIHALPVRYFDRTPVGALVTRVTNDVEALAELFSSGVAAIFSDLLTLLLMVVVLFAINAKMAVVALAALPLVIAFSLWFGGRMRLAYRDVRRRISQLNGFQQEAFTGIPVTRLFGREARMDERFSQRNVGLRDAQYGAIFNFALFWPVVEGLSTLALGGLLVLAASMVNAGLSWAELTYFWFALQLFFRPIRELSDRFNVLQAAMAAGERVFAVLDEEPEEADAPGALAPARLQGDVEFRDVHFSYLPDEPVLRGISFRVRPGETVALVGPTGAGKTSVISLVSRLWDPQRGRVLVDGHDVREYARRALRSRIAVVMQDVFLFDGTVEDNIRLFDPGVEDERVRAAAETVHAAPFVERLPQGYAAEVRERGGNLSVGQKQLLAFARALAADPDVLILDEATSSIDTETERLIQDALRKLLEGRTALVIAHRLSTIREADRILVLHHGRLAEEGTHEQLLARGGLYARLHELSYP